MLVTAVAVPPDQAAAITICAGSCEIGGGGGTPPPPPDPPSDCLSRPPLYSPVPLPINRGANLDLCVTGQLTIYAPNGLSANQLQLIAYYPSTIALVGNPFGVEACMPPECPSTVDSWVASVPGTLELAVDGPLGNV